MTAVVERLCRCDECIQARWLLRTYDWRLKQYGGRCRLQIDLWEAIVNADRSGVTLVPAGGKGCFGRPGVQDRNLDTLFCFSHSFDRKACLRRTIDKRTLAMVVGRWVSIVRCDCISEKNLHQVKKEDSFDAVFGGNCVICRGPQIPQNKV